MRLRSLLSFSLVMVVASPLVRPNVTRASDDTPFLGPWAHCHYLTVTHVMMSSTTDKLNWEVHCRVPNDGNTYHYEIWLCGEMYDSGSLTCSSGQYIDTVVTVSNQQHSGHHPWHYVGISLLRGTETVSADCLTEDCPMS